MSEWHSKQTVCVETGMTFKSRKYAALEFDLEPYQVMYSVKTGFPVGSSDLHFRDAADTEYIAYPRLRTKVVCVETGEVFRTQTEAGEHFGIDPHRVHESVNTGVAVNRGKLHFRYEDDDTYEPRPSAFNARPIVCVETGQAYNTLQEAALDADVATLTITRSATQGTPLKSNGLHYRYAGDLEYEALPAIDTPKGKACRCVETGEKFKSRVDAARYFMTRPSCIRQSIKTGRTCAGYHFENI